MLKGYNEFAEARFATESRSNSLVASALYKIELMQWELIAMGTIYKKRITRPLPVGATVTTKRRRATAKELRRNPSQTTVAEQVAKWRDRTGELQTGIVVERADGSKRVRVESATYYCQYRDGDRLHHEVPTGCRDKETAKAFLAERLLMAERVEAKVVTSAELATVEHESTPIDFHVADYLAFLKNKRGKGKRRRVSPRHVQNVATALRRIVADCNFDRLNAIRTEAVAGWFTARLADTKADMSPRRINAHLSALKAFCNWAVAEKRLRSNPVADADRLDESTGQKRVRRAMSPDELARLLVAAQLRPVAEYGRKTAKPVKRATEPAESVKPSSRKTWTKEPLSFSTLRESFKRGRAALRKTPDKIAELELLGLQRALIYKTLLMTGLRKSELASVRVRDVHLESSPGWLTVEPENEKAGKGADVPLRADLANDLRDWLADRRRAFVRRQGLKLNADTRQDWFDEPLFDVPGGLVVVFNRDLIAADIPKTDERGRTLDVHSLRHTFASLLNAAGVAPRTAQEAMRHSEIGLTMRHYTDPKLLDVAGAIESLPVLSLDIPAIPEQVAATGTDTTRSFVAKTVANNPDFAATFESIPDNSGERTGMRETPKKPANMPVSTGFSAKRATGLEPATCSLGSYHSTN